MAPDQTSSTLQRDPGICPQCGASLPEPGRLCTACLLAVGLAASASEDDTPDVPGYRVERCLGAGGMGTVYLAEELELGREVAIKVMKTSAGGRRREAARARFLREARTMAAVEHPHIVRVYRVGRTADGREFLAMEYVDGETLAERIERQGTVRPHEALRLVRQTVEALAAAWDRDVVHRDVKPSNLFLDRRGRIRVGDFGLARPVEIGASGQLTGSGVLLGTPAYMSPEQARGREVGFRSDVYSLGIVLFEMLTGRVPYRGDDPITVAYRHLHEDVPELPEEVGAPEGVGDLVRWMTAREAEGRPGSYGELLHRLDELLLMLGGAPTAALPFGGLSSMVGGGVVLRGRLVPKRCDRRRQVAAFVHHYREHLARRPRAPVFYLVPGPAGQCHDSLVERLVHEHVVRLARAVTGGGSILTRRVGWPDGEDALELRAFLTSELFTELEPLYSGLDLDARALARSERLARHDVVVIQHELREITAEKTHLELLEWYLDEFWAGFEPEEQSPRVVVFISWIAPPGPEGWLAALTTSARRRRRFERGLTRLFEKQGLVARRALSPLGPIRPDHVLEWLAHHNVLESEKARRSATRDLFGLEEGSVDALPMAEIEDALQQIHHRALREKGMSP